MCAIRRNAWRIKRRKIGINKIMSVLQSCPRRINCKSAKSDNDHQRLKPPIVFTQSFKLVQTQCSICHVSFLFLLDHRVTGLKLIITDASSVSSNPSAGLLERRLDTQSRVFHVSAWKKLDWETRTEWMTSRSAIYFTAALPALAR